MGKLNRVRQVNYFTFRPCAFATGSLWSHILNLGLLVLCRAWHVDLQDPVWLLVLLLGVSIIPEVKQYL